MGMFPKVHGWILEDSGRFLATCRIPRGLGLKIYTVHVSPVFGSRDSKKIEFKKVNKF